MRKIAVLDQNTIDKIAAGEVVERPSSVVKELVENAIDAGATAVTVEITDGGKKLIRITDNGAGIEADQIPLAFLRHATSKIEKVEDLAQIASLGFRGEALSSIAAVSQVELITKTPTAVSGSRYIIEGGVEHSLEELGAPDGTTFLVRNLFYNTPARSKFLKSDMTEANYIHTLMEQLALSHPEISFKYIQNKQVKLHSSGNYSVKDVIYSVYGREITRALLEVQYENSFMKVTGFVGKPEIARGNRTFENYYINGRYVKNNIITKAIENAYRGFLMQHKFPFVSLQMEMEGNDLDVNVHPAKREVRFAREQEVYDAVYDTVRGALTRREMIPKVSVGKDEAAPKEEKVRSADVPEPFEVKRRQQLYGQAVREPSAEYGRSAAFAGEKIHINIGQESEIKNTTDVFSKSEEHLFAGTLRGKQDEDNRRAEEQKQSLQTTENHRQDGAVPAGSQQPPGNPGSSPDESQRQTDRSQAVQFQTKQPQTVQSQAIQGAAEQACVSPTAPVQVQPEQARTDGSADIVPTDNSDGSPNESQKQAVQSKEVQVMPDQAHISPTASGQVHSEQIQQDSPASAALTPTEKPKQLELFEEKLLAPESRQQIRLIGQIFDTYWLAQFGDTFYIIDQHAAHEKVYYERFVKRFREHSIDSQYLNPPLIITLNLQEEATLLANKEYFRQFGFEIENFGGREYCVSAVPSNLYGLTEEELFLEMLDNLAGEGAKDALDIFAARLATMACKAAVKGNHMMSPQEAEALIDELLTLENPYHCPHGRPTIIAMTKTELEKKFKRIV